MLLVKHPAPKKRKAVNHCGRQQPLSFGGRHLPTIKWKAQPHILEHTSTACSSMTGGQMGPLGAGWDVEYIGRMSGKGETFVKNSER